LQILFTFWVVWVIIESDNQTMETQMSEITNEHEIEFQIASGHFKVNVLTAVDGQKYLPLIQVVDLFRLRQNRPTHTVKTLLGKGCADFTRFGRIDVLSLAEFKTLLRALDKQRNPIAMQVVDAALDMMNQQIVQKC
jgi:hypothetical protein